LVQFGIRQQQLHIQAVNLIVNISCRQQKASQLAAQRLDWKSRTTSSFW
jgi:hypothetical protein